MGKWTRRGFITAGVVAGGALVVGVAIRPGNRSDALEPLVAADGEQLLGAWLKVAPDGTVTAIVPHSEMGQGAQTALAQMLAEELDAAWSQVTFMEAPPDPEFANYGLGKGYILGPADIPAALVGTVDGVFLAVAKAMDLQITGGSLSVRATGVTAMRSAGAAARDMFVRAAADTWQVPADQVQVREGVVSHPASGRSAGFGELLESAARLDPPAKPRLKDPSEWTIAGQPLQRLDIPAKVDGSAQFALDVRLPGLKYAAVKAAPVFGGSVTAVDDAAVANAPGVQAVVDLGDAVGVVADGWWQARQAVEQLVISFSDDGNAGVDSAAIFAQFRNDLDAGELEEDLRSGDSGAVIAAAERVVEADYQVPYLAHATMEPMNCTARVADGKAEIWVGCQNPLGFRNAVAKALELDPADVTLHNHLMGGGFGRRAMPDYAIQAARLAQETGHPVQLIWSREEDTRRDHYRPAVVSRFRAALDADGRPLAWENRYVDKHEPVEAPLIPYAIPAQRIGWVASPTHVPFGPWRSVDHSQHGFFTESFIDELAVAAGQDPYRYRRELLADHPRHLAVLDMAAEQAGWDAALPEGWGRGIALQQSFGTIVAEVVEVEVPRGGPRQGKARVHRVVCAVDAGYAINPDGLAAQMESGIIYGLTAALYGNIEIRGGAVVQGNFHDYPMLRMDEAPVIETHILDSGAAIGGAGEPGTPGIAPALANAVHAATGVRVRRLPLADWDLSYRVEEA